MVGADFVTTHRRHRHRPHRAAFGEDDMAVGRAHGLDAPNPVDRHGRFTDAVGP